MINLFRNSALLVCCFLFFGIQQEANAQLGAPPEDVTLAFKDGKKLYGIGRIASKNRIKFKKKLGEKAIKYSFEDLEYAVINGDRYKMFKLKHQENKKAIIVREVIVGEVSLYTTSSSGYNAGANSGVNGNFSFGGNYYNISNYYLKYKNDLEIIHLGSNQLFSKNFKTGAAKFFKDCPKLVEKIMNKEKGFKKKDLERIVKYYNLNCK